MKPVFCLLALTAQVAIAQWETETTFTSVAWPDASSPPDYPPATSSASAVLTPSNPASYSAPSSSAPMHYSFSSWPASIPASYSSVSASYPSVPPSYSGIPAYPGWSTSYSSVSASCSSAPVSYWSGSASYSSIHASYSSIPASYSRNSPTHSMIARENTWTAPIPAYPTLTDTTMTTIASSPTYGGSWTQTGYPTRSRSKPYVPPWLHSHTSWGHSTKPGHSWPSSSQTVIPY